MHIATPVFAVRPNVTVADVYGPFPDMTAAIAYAWQWEDVRKSFLSRSDDRSDMPMGWQIGFPKSRKQGMEDATDHKQFDHECADDQRRCNFEYGDAA